LRTEQSSQHAEMRATHLHAVLTHHVQRGTVPQPHASSPIIHLAHMVEYVTAVIMHLAHMVEYVTAVIMHLAHMVEYVTAVIMHLAHMVEYVTAVIMHLAHMVEYGTAMREEHQKPGAHVRTSPSVQTSL